MGNNASVHEQKERNFRELLLWQHNISRLTPEQVEVVETVAEDYDPYELQHGHGGYYALLNTVASAYISHGAAFARLVVPYRPATIDPDLLVVAPMAAAELVDTQGVGFGRRAVQRKLALNGVPHDGRWFSEFTDLMNSAAAVANRIQKPGYTGGHPPIFPFRAQTYVALQSR
jgi:hypothetical protein